MTLRTTPALWRDSDVRVGAASCRSVALAEPTGGPSALPVPAPTWLAGPLPATGASWRGPPWQGAFRRTAARAGPGSRRQAPAAGDAASLSGRPPRPARWRRGDAEWPGASVARAVAR